jgi:hypothetical protein
MKYVKDLELINSLRKVCDYIYEDEYKDYHYGEWGIEPKDHIFNHIQRLEEHCQLLEKELNSIERKTIEDFF